MKQVFLLAHQNWPCRLLFFATLLACAATGSAQGLYKTYYSPAIDAGVGYDVGQLPNGNYRVAANSDVANGTDIALRHRILDINPAGDVVDSLQGVFPVRTFWLRDMTFLQPAQDFISADSVMKFIRLSPQYDTLWTQTITVPEGLILMEWVQADIDAGGNIWVAGVWLSFNGNETRLILLKFTPEGEIAWQKTYPTDQPDDMISEVTVRFGFTPDNGCILKQVVNAGTQVIRFDASGQIVWKKTVPINSSYAEMAVSADARSLILGFQEVLCLDAGGNTLFQYSLGTGPFQTEAAISTADGGWAVMNKIFVQSISHPYTFKLSASGQVVWSRIYDIPWFKTKAGHENTNRELLWAGGGPTLLRTDSAGVLFKNHLAGHLAYDENLDCAVQPAETGIPGWVLKLESAGATQYTVADSSGYYYFAEADTGQQTLTPIAQNYLWQACSPSFTSYIHPDSSNLTVPLDAPIRSLSDCPVMTIDLATPRLRRCFDNPYAVHICNYGNQTATNAYVEVFLPPHLLLQSVSLPYTQDGLKLTIPLGDVAAFDCRDVQLIVRPDCDSTELGEALCVSAHVFPDSICAPPPGWSGALIEVSAACDGDSVRFEIHNTGTAPTSQALDFIVIDDHVMTLQGDFTLAAGAIRQEAFPADGSTWRLQAEQEPNAPGATLPSVAVEGCATGGGLFNTGYVVQWPNENGSPFWARDCHEVIGAFDPNTKQAAPLGVDDERWIKPNTPIEYLIEFQNTGTDTAFTVVLRDTLAPGLDPATLRPGAGSHPYTWNLSGANVLTFRFDHILLPDSNTNEPASHGFMQFWVQQYPDLPDGAEIENRAGIYFDFNLPVITNTVLHTVGRDFIPTVSTRQPLAGRRGFFSVYPNPAQAVAAVLWRDSAPSEGHFTLFDALGRSVWSGLSSGKSVEIRRGAWPAGVYWLQWTGVDGLAWGERVVWR